ATIYADGTAPLIIAIEADQAPGYPSGAKFLIFKTPGQNSMGGAVFIAGVNGAVTSASNSAIYAVTGGAGGRLDRIVSKGSVAAGAGNAVRFKAFTGAAA